MTHPNVLASHATCPHEEHVASHATPLAGGGSCGPASRDFSRQTAQLAHAVVSPWKGKVAACRDHSVPHVYGRLQWCGWFCWTVSGNLVQGSERGPSPVKLAEEVREEHLPAEGGEQLLAVPAVQSPKAGHKMRKHFLGILHAHPCLVWSAPSCALCIPSSPPTSLANPLPCRVHGYFRT